MTPIVIGYFADGPWSHDALERLLADQEVRVAFICARYQRPDPVLAQRAEAIGVPFLTHPKINSDEFRHVIAGFGCDLLVSMSFDQIFRTPLASLPRLGTINCHAGMLPFYRGRNILNWALINDEQQFGITVHYVDEGVDTGDIIVQRGLPITDDDDYGTLLQRAYVGCGELLHEAVTMLRRGTASRRPQSAIHPVGFYCSARREGDEVLDWNRPSREVFNFVRAICRPGPEARTRRDQDEIRINQVRLVPDAPTYKGIPGAVLGVSVDGVLVKTQDSFVRVVEFSGVEKLRVGDRLG